MKKNYTIFKNLTFKIAIALVMLNCFFANAQSAGGTVTVTTNSGSGLSPTYGSLAAAVTALNAATITSPVVINLNAPEMAPAGGYAITASGTAVNTIVINGNNNIVTANNALTVGSITDAIFKLVGADYITVNNFIMIENPLNTISATALTNNMTEWGVALLYATTTNGAQNNTISNNSITLNRVYSSTFGIYSNSTHAATTPSTTATATTAAGSNTGLTATSNTITNVNAGIVVVGPSGVADYNPALTIGGASGAGNTITDYGTASPLSTFANVSTNCVAILVRFTSSFNISYNTITSSNGGYTGTVMRGIYIPSFTTAPTGTLVQVIDNNTLSIRPGASGTLTSIGVEANTGNATTSLSISNNDFNNTTHTVASTGVVTFISNVSPVLTTNINGNTFTNLSVNTTGNVNFIANNVARPANAICNVNNNRIVTGFIKTGAGATVSFYNSFSTSTSTVTEINTGNDFSNISVNGATTIAGWVSGDGTTTTPFGPSKTVSNNTFSNIIGGTNGVTILTVSFSNANGTSTVANNTISNISNGAAVTCLTSTQGKQTFTGNTITNITSSGASPVSGIVITQGVNQLVTKNKIGNMESNNAGGTVNGVLISGGTAGGTMTVQNNTIGDLRSPLRNSATVDGVRGISITSTAATSTYNVYNNTIALAAVSSGADFSSAGIFHAASATATTAALDLRNNIVVNGSTPSGTGTAAALRRSGIALNNLATTSNNNDLVAPVIMADGTNTYTTIGAYQTAVAPTRETASITAIPVFLSLVAATPTFLHIDATVPTAIESGATSIATVADDFDGDIRQGAGGYTGTGFAPDMGADEINGISLGTVDFTTVDFTVYPNPTTGILNIASTKEISEISVYNLLGQTIMSQKANALEVQMDLSSLSRAAYLVKIVAEGQVKVLKVLKQ